MNRTQQLVQLLKELDGKCVQTTLATVVIQTKEELAIYKWNMITNQWECAIGAKIVQ